MTEDARAQRRRRWGTFAVLAAIAALTILDVSKVGVALPAIQASTGGDGTTIQFMLIGYTLAYAVTLLPAGRLGDIVSRKRMFLVGCAVFLVASVVCALSPDIHVLVGGRLLQGAGAGILMPQVLGLIQRIFPAEERARPLAALAAIIAATSLFGPVLAGVVMQLVGGPESWRALFWINVGVGIIVLPIAIVVLRDVPGERRRGFDLLGVALLVPAVLLAVGPLSAISQSTPPSWWMLAATLTGGALAALFVAHEIRRSRRGLQALIDPRLLLVAHVPTGVLVSGFMYAAGTAGTLVVTISLQQVAGLTALETALWMLPGALATIAASWVAARLPQRATYRLIAIGTGLGAVGLGALSVVFGTLPTAVIPIAVSLLLISTAFGSGLSGPPNQARTLAEVPEYRASVAGSLIQFSQRVGSAIGMAVALILYYGLGSAPTLAGRPTLGTTVALAVVAAFLVGATLIALLDTSRTRRRAATAADPVLSASR